MKWVRRIRGALGMGLLWAVAWSAGGVLVALGFVLQTGSRPDPPIPMLFGVAGFLSGLVFSVVLGALDGRRRFEQLSIPRFAAWGATGGLVLATSFVLAMARRDPAFLANLIVVGPAVALAAAASAAGSLYLARKSQQLASSDAPDRLANPRPKAENGVGQ
jgi:drug/metabolite transporter (DMT)-like permease